MKLTSNIDTSYVLSEPPNHDGMAVLMCHGFGSNKDQAVYKTLEKLLNAKDITTLRFDYIGHGRLPGKAKINNAEDVVEHTRRMVKMLESFGYTKIGMMGTSAGAYMTLKIIDEFESIKFAVLKSPVVKMSETLDDLADINKSIRGQYSIAINIMLMLNRITDESIKSLRNLKIKPTKKPVSVVIGSKDDVVRYDSVKTYCTNNGYDLYTVANGDHGLRNASHLAESTSEIYAQILSMFGR